MRQFDFELQRFAMLEGTSGNDTIRNTIGTSAIIYSYGGSDSIYNGYSSVTINTGTGDDTVYNSGNYVSIYSGEGNDSIYAEKSYVTIDAAEGNDTIFSRSSGARIYADAGAGSDSIYNNASSSTIYAGAGDDTIVSTSYATINAGTGSDVISISGSSSGYLICYADGDGSDTIYNASQSDSISISGATYSRSTVGSDLLLKVTGSGSILLKDAASISPNILGTIEGGGINIVNSTADTIIIGTAYADTIYNYSARVTIQTGTGDDSIYARSYGSIDAGAGNDTISLTGSYTTIDAGTGNDSIFSYSSYSTINAGDGNDLVSLSSDSGNNGNTISGGKGNDTIYMNGQTYQGDVYQYASGDGSDTIFNWSSHDTIRISDSTYTTARNGNDFIIKVGSGSVVLKNVLANYTKLNVADSSGSVTTYNDWSIWSGSSGDDTIRNDYDNVTILGNGGNDSIDNRGVEGTLVDGGAGNDTIGEDYWTAFAHTINGGNDNDYISGSGYYCSVYGGTGNDTIYFDGLRIFSNYNTIDGGAGDDSIMAGDGGSNIFGGADNDIIRIYSNTYYQENTVSGGTGSDTIYMESATSLGNIYQYASGDGFDTIYNLNPLDTIQITSGSYTTLTSGDDFIISVGSGSMVLKNVLLSDYNKIRIKDSEGNISVYHDWSVWNGSSGTETIHNVCSNVTILGNGGNDSIRNYGEGVIIYGGDSVDSIDNYGGYSAIFSGASNDLIFNWSSSHSTISGGDGADRIYSYGNYDSILGGAGNDTVSLDSYYANSTVAGGADNDIVYLNRGDGYGYFTGNVYQYAIGDGDDTIYYLGPNDTIHITSGGYSTLINGNDFIINVGSGSILLKNALADSYNKVRIKNPAGSISVYNDWSIRSGTSGNDNIRNYANNVTILGNNGNDSIENRGWYATIEGGAGIDRIENRVDYVVVKGGEGDDYISNNGDYTRIDAGAGNDSIYSYSDYLTINGGTGADTIRVGGFSVEAYGSAGDDVVSLKSDPFNGRRTLAGGTGNDTIYLSNSPIRNDKYEDNGGEIYLYENGDGDDVIYYAQSYDTISIGGGNYSTQVSGSDLIVKVGTGAMTLVGAANRAVNIAGSLVPDKVITGTAGADKISNTIVGATINALAGNDTVVNSGDEVLISGGAGSDRLSLDSSSRNVTLSGDAGADTIWTNGTGNLIQYGTADGKDVIVGFSGEDSIKIGGTISKSVQSGANVLVTIGSGTSNVVTIRNVALDNLSLNGGIITYVEESIPYGWKYNSSLKTGFIATVNSAEDVDLNESYGTSVVTVNASISSSGIDIVGNSKANSIVYGGSAGSIDGGAGNDKISLGSSATKVTVIGGSGNDTLYSNGKGNVILYNSGDGNDSIIGIGANDTLKITGGTYSTLTSGANVVVSVYSGSTDSLSGRITLKGTTLPEIDGTLKAGYPKSLTTGADSIIISDDEATVYGLAGNDTIQITGNVGYFDGGAGNDKLSLGSNETGNTLYGGAGADIVYTNGAGNLIKYGTTDGKDVIYGFNGNDSIQIAGTIKNSAQSGANVLVTVGTGTGNVLTIRDVVLGNLNLNADVITYTENPPDSLYPMSLTSGKDSVAISDDNATVYALAGNDTLRIYGNDGYFNGGTGNDSIINEGNVVTLIGDVGNDTIITNGDTALIEAGAGSDKISLGNDAGNVTISGGAGADTIYSNGTGNLIQYGTGGGKDVIFGFSKDDSIQITAGSVGKSIESGDNVLVTIGSGTQDVITIRDVKLKNLSIKNKTITIIDLTPNTLTSGADKFENDEENATILAIGGNDSVVNHGDNVYLDGGAGNDTLISSGNNNSISGGAGNDVLSLSADASNATLIGGAGKDTIYTSGKGDVVQYGTGDGLDTLYGFGGTDEIHISGNIRNSLQVGENVNVTVGSGTANILTIMNVKLKELQYADGTITKFNNEISLTSGADKATVADDGVIVYALAGNDSIRNAKSEVTIYGGEGKDMIINDGENVLIDSGAGDDRISLGENATNATIIGGKGNDSISTATNASPNLLIYEEGDGNDTIIGFSNGDSIQVNSGTISKPAYSSTNATFTVSGGKIILRNVAYEEFSTEDNVITFKSDGRRQTIYGSEQADDMPNTLTNVIIDAYGGSDSISNGGNSVTIYGGSGYDTIVSSGNDGYIEGGAGNDSISLANDTRNVTINGGAGADTIYTNGNGNLIQYAAGGGKDVIFGFSGNDSLEITGTISKTLQSGANVLITVGSSSNVITLKDTKLANLSCDGNVITTSEAVGGSNGYWFTDDLNFVESDNNLDAISEVSEDGYAVDKISDTGVESLTPIEILTSYSDK